MKLAFLVVFICLFQLAICPTSQSQTVATFSDEFAQSFENEFESSESGFEFEPESESEGEQERIETERHDFTQSTTVVGRGVTQVEFGYSFFQLSEEAEVEDSHTTPESVSYTHLTLPTICSV